MQVQVFNSCVAHYPFILTGIKCRLREAAIWLIVTCSMATKESLRVRNSCFAWRTPAWTTRNGSHLVCCCPTRPLFILLLAFWDFVEWVLPHDEFHADRTYFAFPTSEMFCLPFAELLDLTRQELEIPHGRIQRWEVLWAWGPYCMLCVCQTVLTTCCT